jgi:hypothetical protein
MKPLIPDSDPEVGTLLSRCSWAPAETLGFEQKCPPQVPMLKVWSPDGGATLGGAETCGGGMTLGEPRPSWKKWGAGRGCRDVLSPPAPRINEAQDGGLNSLKP